MKISNFLRNIVILSLILSFSASIILSLMAKNPNPQYSFNLELEPEIESEESLKSKNENSEILASRFNFNSINLIFKNFKYFNLSSSLEFFNEVPTSPPNNC
ncbi:MAG: hypothetical protein ACO26G_02710 [Rickettsiales bacterium]